MRTKSGGNKKTKRGGRHKKENKKEEVAKMKARRSSCARKSACIPSGMTGRGEGSEGYLFTRLEPTANERVNRYERVYACYVA